ncbi:Uncharacterised protein [Escherichia coli]|nr:Uncharacterised protein [Escherichia coli]
MARTSDPFCARIYGRSEPPAGNHSRRAVPCWRTSLAAGLHTCLSGAGGSLPAPVGSGYQPPYQSRFAAARYRYWKPARKVTTNPISGAAAGVVQRTADGRGCMATMPRSVASVYSLVCNMRGCITATSVSKPAMRNLLSHKAPDRLSEC